MTLTRDFGPVTLARDLGPMTLALDLKYLFIIYMGFLNGHWRSETSQKAHKRERDVGFHLTADEHYHLKGKRLTGLGAPVDNSDGTTKKFVTDLLNQRLLRATSWYELFAPSLE